MHHVAKTAPGYPLVSSCIAAELLVLTDQVAPLAAEPSSHDTEHLDLDGLLATAVEWERWSVRQQIRQELATEARKADLGQQ